MYFVLLGLSFIILFFMLSQFFERWFEKGMTKHMVVTLFSLILAIGLAQGISKLIHPVNVPPMPQPTSTEKTKLNNVVTRQRDSVDESLQQDENNTREAVENSEK